MVPKELQDARETYDGAIAATGRILRTLRGEGAFTVESAESVVEALLAQLEISDALMVPFLSTMTGVSSPAAETIGPCVLSLRIGMELDDPRPELGRLGLSALLYDIGRAGVSKGSDATAIRRGVEEQVQLSRQRGPCYAEVADLVLRTHDGPNESGPAAGKYRTVDEHVHVITLAATYHSLARQRGTRERSWPPAGLKEILQRQRGHFPDKILKALIGVLATLPVGGLVRLNSGEIGYVVAKNDGFPLRPVVAVWISLGKLLAEPKPVDLQQNPFLYVNEFLGEAKLEPDLAGRLS